MKATEAKKTTKPRLSRGDYIQCKIMHNSFPARIIGETMQEREKVFDVEDLTTGAARFVFPYQIKEILFKRR